VPQFSDTRYSQRNMDDWNQVGTMQVNYYPEEGQGEPLPLEGQHYTVTGQSQTDNCYNTFYQHDSRKGSTQVDHGCEFDSQHYLALGQSQADQCSSEIKNLTSSSAKTNSTEQGCVSMHHAVKELNPTDDELKLKNQSKLSSVKEQQTTVAAGSGNDKEVFRNQLCHQIYRIGNLDVPMVTEQDDSESTPNSIGYVGATLSLSNNLRANVYICIDTGADLTVCTSQFLLNHFGERALSKINTDNPTSPPLKSATGHPLKMMGVVKVNIVLGTYSFKTDVLVYQHKAATFLLGNSCIYNRLIYNAGKSLAFVTKGHKPIPIKYFKPFPYAAAVNYCSIAPRSTSIVELRVGDPIGIPDQTVMLTALDNPNPEDFTWNSPIQDTVAKATEHGTAYVWVENSTDDQLTILPDVPIARVPPIADQVTSVIKHFISRHYDPEVELQAVNDDSKLTKAENWSIKAL